MNRIGDYALIGDCHSAALVGRDASIDWLCFPRFDSPAVFAAVLDAERGGSFTVEPDELSSVTRSYLDRTNVLTTIFVCAGGTLEVTDAMVVAAFDPDAPADVGTEHAVLRQLRCTAGAVTVTIRIRPRFETGGFVPRFRLTGDETAEIVGGADALWVTATRSIDESPGELRARWRLGEGDTEWVHLAWTPSHIVRDRDRAPTRAELADRLDATTSFWRTWADRNTYDGEHADAIRRSSLVLKALTYAPTGAVVAAPTTSLPEHIGGGRNWDYRYTWIRDATLTLISLFSLGYRDEAAAFKRWLERTGAGRPRDLQIMYGIGGERSLPELELEHLSGHRGSAPVRVGNGAVKQRQLDSYGQILEAAYLWAKAGGTLTPHNWAYCAGLADIVAGCWRDPDQGIWEIRDEPRHFVHSKVNCWAALDRAVRLSQMRGLPGSVRRWSAERDAIAEHLLDDARARGWFAQAVGGDEADAAVLLVPALGLLPTGDPLVQETMDRVTADLGDAGLLYRYRAADGLDGGEGAFLLCSFWMLDCYIHSGRLDEADVLLARLTSLANDVGLWAEEADPATGEALGNTPQAFTHMAHITSCISLDAARRGAIDHDRAYGYAELAIDRLELRTRPPGT